MKEIHHRPKTIPKNATCHRLILSMPKRIKKTHGTEIAKQLTKYVLL